MYINKEWCNNAAVVLKHCSLLVEFVFVKFTAIVIVMVYIPPCANAKDALRELYSAISEQQTNNPDGFFIIAGDFNHANLKTVLPKFYQHVNFATKGNNTHNRTERLQGCTPPPPRVLGSHLCYANPSIQTTSQTCQTGSKTHHNLAR